MAGADGSQLQVELPGLIGAAYAPDSSWRPPSTAAVRCGGCRRPTAPLELVATGPFIGKPIIEADGAVVALRVPSVEAPYQSELVRVTPEGAATALTTEPLVYGAQPMADGSLAAVAHRPGGHGRAAAGRRSGIGHGRLGADAVNVAIDRSAGPSPGSSPAPCSCAAARWASRTHRSRHPSALLRERPGAAARSPDGNAADRTGR